MKPNKKSVEDRIKKHELNKGDDTASKALFAKIEANRRREGYLSDYESLVNAGIIDEVVAPPNAVNLFDTMKKQRRIVKEAMKDPKNMEIVEQLQREFKERCKKDGYLME